MRLLVFAVLGITASAFGQDADQRKRMIFSTSEPRPDPSPIATATPLPDLKFPSPEEAVKGFFLALKSDQVDAAYDGLVKGTIIAERGENVKELKASTRKALDHYGPIAGFEEVESSQVGASLMRKTCVSLNQDLPLRWRFYFYKSGNDWKIVDMRIDDGLVELFEEAGLRQKK